MISLTSHLLRRGAAFHSATMQAQPSNDPIEIIKAHPASVAIILISTAIFIPALLFMDYILSSVIGHLAMVESPTAIPSTEPFSKLTDPESLDDTDPSAKHRLLNLPPSVPISKPLTSSLRRSLRHLRQTSSLLRGLRLFILYALAFTTLHMLFDPLLTRTLSFAGVGPTFLGPSLSMLVASLLTVRLHAAFVHGVLATAPTETRFRERFITRATARPLVWPAVREGLAQAGWNGAVWGVGKVTRPYVTRNDANPALVLACFLGFVLVALGVGLGLVLPAQVSRVRAVAGLAKGEWDSVVPFERGETVVAENRRCMWNRGVRRVFWRVVKLHVKIMIVGMVVMAMYLGIMGGLVVAVEGGLEKIKEEIGARVMMAAAVARCARGGCGN